MTQGFEFGQPATRSNLASEFVRKNFEALATLNAGDTAPLNPQDGMPWLDTSNAPVTYSLKTFFGGAWQTVVEFPAASSGVSVFRAEIGVASSVWTIDHNLGQDNVSVTLFDLTGKVIEALEIDTANSNQAVVTHAYPLLGSALVIG